MMARPKRVAATVAIACAVIVAVPTAGASADDAPRGRYELELHMGAAVPLPCQRCRGVSAGPTAGILLLWRPSPHFAIGPVAEYASLAWHAAWAEFDDPHARVRSGLPSSRATGRPARARLRASRCGSAEAEPWSLGGSVESLCPSGAHASSRHRAA